MDVTSSTSAYLSWGPPPDESHNGDIVLYVINVTVMETGERFQLTSETTYLEVINLRPYRTYVCVIAAATSVGLGPFSTFITVETPEDGEFCLYVSCYWHNQATKISHTQSQPVLLGTRLVHALQL